ncbi:HupE/UreJ family protein [Roseivivax sp. THAF30]|uniref:HupE/UreJ family protein n=1 Tax=Roseivivax sp. THAF30 TaxID=2587852 RepID=UPI0012A938C6|nr:HupE/UreJ family protein [Roseivivax sp. THAF30]QFT63112.1 hypothetical protein FIU91_09265 [Roseivivax sp. THAF30]
MAVSEAAGTGWLSTALAYVPVGFAHILPLGLDHILFVLALFFMTPNVGPLILQITIFTLAHSVTLALGAFGIVSIPGSIVEPIIAASIVFVAAENMFARRVTGWRIGVIFLFGLLHGLGFASVLNEFGLPDGQFGAALVGFNVGVEIGQIAIIAAMFLVVWVALRVDALDYSERTGQVFYGVLALALVALSFLALEGNALAGFEVSAPLFLLPLAGLSLLCLLAATNVDKLGAYRTYVAIPASAAIGLVGAYWFLERVFL